MDERTSAAQTTRSRFLTFRVAERVYALPGEDVAEIIHIPTVARLPHSPKSLMGLANLRGTVLPIIDLRALLGRGTFAPANTARAIVLTGAAPFALAVDGVDALVVRDHDQVETRQAELAAETGERLRGTFQASAELGVAKILDLPAMLAGEFRDRPSRARQAANAGAAVETAAPAAADEHLLLSFAVADQDYALPLEAVREIVPLPDTITAVPRAEAVLLGVVAYRDGLLPLLSLRGLLGFPSAVTSGGAEKVIVVPVGGVLVGLVADRMRAIIRATESQIDAAPSMLAARTGGEAKITAIFRGGDGRNLVSVLAPEKLFREDVMRRLGDASAMATVQPADAARQQRETIPFVVFRLGDEEFALPISAVDEVARVPDQITRVPRSPAFLEGVINLRGQVLPVVDQRRRFDLPKFAGTDGQRLIVVRSERHRAGLIVDNVSEVLRAPADAIEPAPDLTRERTGDGAPLISGVINAPATGRMILLLDPSELLTRAERGVLDTLDLEATGPAAEL
jgi:purine-binding chemotaxis protein CheW